MTSCEHHNTDNASSKKLCIAKVPIFNHLPYADMLEIARTSHNKTYQKGDIIFEAGNASEHLYIVHRGQVKIYRLTPSGKEQLIRIMEPGDFMGELSLFTEETLTSYAEAMKKTEICAIHKSDLRSLIVTKPEIALHLLEAFSKRMNETEKTIERFSAQDTEKRIAAYLVELADVAFENSTTDSGLDITLPMSKGDLASYIGMTQETLSRRLSAFQDNGWIAQSGQRGITILDYTALYDRTK